jgi:hypothetical protein
MLDVIDPGLVDGAVAGAMFLCILLVLEIGRWLGRRSMGRDGTSVPVNVDSLETAVFALLGLLIAFTFSGALTRFDVRRAQVVDEANAIGTAYLRIDLLPAPARQPLRDTFRNYLDSRIATYRKMPQVDAARLELTRSQALQASIWTQAVAALRVPESRSETALLVLPALNEMFDITTVRVVATQMHPPMIIYGMVVALALASALLAGYRTAADARHGWTHNIAFAAVVALTLYVIVDLEYPRSGWIRIDPIDEVLVNLRAGMN